jgi:uncharacterized NAD(P)/FAD-binding protein YdhS
MSTMASNRLNIMRFNFAIIGGGLTATAMLCQLVNRAREKAKKRHLDPSRIQINVIERQDIFGPGFPHSGRFAMPFHITNMCAADMGILDGKPCDFQEWVTANSDHLRNLFSWFSDVSSAMDGSGETCNHYPRAIMGEYLKTRFREAVQFARKAGLAVRLHPESEVVDLKRNKGRFSLVIKDLVTGKYFSDAADRVLLATGHWFERNHHNGYFTSPWPAEKLRRSIPQGATVAIIGTSLSAIETLLTLTSEGEFIRSASGELVYEPPESPRRFFLYSRKGLLPKVRGKIGQLKNRFLNRENLDRLLSDRHGRLTLNAIFNLLQSELEDAYGQAIDWNQILHPTGRPADLLKKYLDDAIHGDGPCGELIWQTILHQSFDMVRDIYLNLTLEDRMRFDKEYTSVFFTHAATQPIVNAEKLLALMKAGMVDVLKLGDNYRLNKDDVKNCYEFVYSDHRGYVRRDAFRFVVDSRGQQKSLKTNPSPLVKNLLTSGMVQIEEIRPVDQSNHSGQDDPSEFEAADRYKTGSIWIDPETHQAIQIGPGNETTTSSGLYAVGAMTRGQIINASMARGIVEATCRIADDLIHYLTQTYRGEIDENKS